MQFLGDLDDVCTISFVPIREIANPVGFDAYRAFECDSVVEWITKHRPTNPITTLPIQGRVVDVLSPLIINGDDAHVSFTRIKLSEAGNVMSGRYRRIREAFGPLIANTALYFLAAYVLGFPLILLAICSSWAHLAYHTCKTYPRDGKDLLASCFSVFVDVFILGGLMEMDLYPRMVLAQGLVLCMQLMVNIRQQILAARDEL